MPVIKVQEKVKQMQPGEELLAICTDPGVKHDIPAWCKINGHEVLSIETQQEEFLVKVKVGDHGA